MRPSMLPVDDSATVWSVRAGDVDDALARRPLLVLMHGYGSDEADLAGLFPHLGDDLLMASLRAPLPGPGTGYSWFPLDRPGDPDAVLVAAAVEGVRRWLEDTQSRARVHGAVGLLGFSQGGAMAIQLMRHWPEAFACAVNLSGFVPGGLVAGDEALAQIRPPVLWGRDEADPVITPAAVARTLAFLPAHTSLTTRLYPGAGHGISGEELADVAAFVARHLLPG